MAKKVYEESKIAAIGAKIREKTGGGKTYKTSEMPSGIDEVYDAGKQAEYDAFWDKFQNNGKRTAYTACFGGDHWNNGLLNPKYDIYITNAMYTFYYSTLNVDFVKYFEDIGKVFSFEGETTRERNLNSTFQYSQFTRVGKIYSTGVNWYSTFYGCTKLVTIDEAGNGDENGDVKFTTSTFNTCSALENITIRGKIATSTNFQWSPLTVESMKNIIAHLKDYSGTSNALKYTITFSDACWAALEADSVAPDGDTWKDYVYSLGWNA